LILFEKSLHSSSKKQQGIKDVLDHMNKGGNVSDATIVQNIKALLSTVHEHEQVMQNLSCMCMMILMSDEWNKMSYSAAQKVGEDSTEQLRDMMKDRFGGNPF